MNIEEAKRIINIGLGKEKNLYTTSDNVLKASKIILNELDKKDKIIDMMAKYIRAGDIEEDICKDIEECIPENLQCENCIKEYFYKKAEEN